MRVTVYLTVFGGETCELLATELQFPLYVTINKVDKLVAVSPHRKLGKIPSNYAEKVRCLSHSDHPISICANMNSGFAL